MNRDSQYRLDIEKKWKILAESWMNAPPPAAPSEDDVNIYFRNASKESTKVLILGVTPALRVASEERSLVHFALDCTPEMISASNNVVPERLWPFGLLGDWLDMPFMDESFDIVMGDKVLGNLMPELWAKFFAEIERVLRSGGEFRTRATPNGKDKLERWAESSFDSAVRKWARKIEDGVALKTAVASLWEDRMNASIHSNDGLYGKQSLKNGLPLGELEEIIKSISGNTEKTLLHAFFDKYKGTMELIWSAYSDSAVIKSETKGLIFVRREFANDYDSSKKQPCYIFKKEN